MSSAKSFIVLIGVSALGLGAVAACSATSTPLGFDDGTDSGFSASLPEAGPVTPAADGGPIPSQDSSTGDLDTGVIPPPFADASDDATVDAATDAPVEAGPDAAGADAGPTGSTCPTKDLVGKQSCGLCGFQTRLCAPSTPSDPASPLAWEEWGFCQHEVVGGCVPGTATNEACGLCGTRAKVCQIDCQYAVGACKNEPVGACSPGNVDFQTGLSCSAGGRSRTCGPTCEYGSFGACFVPGEPTLVLAGAAGGKTTGQFTLPPATKAPRLTGTCPSGSVNNSATSYSYVVLVNPTANALTVSVWNGKSTNAGSADIDTVMASYVTATKPTTDTERTACSTGVNDDCSNSSDATACLHLWSGLFGTSAVTVPANGKAYIYVAALSTSTSGDYQLTARTDTVN
jgi:hypothetical protein